MLINYNISIRKISDFNDLEIIGEYESYQITNYPLLKFHPQTEIKNIYNYIQGAYHFASKFTDYNNNFLFGICFGFDELELVDNHEFDEMLSVYNNHISEHLY